jgi:hypothetical protein
MVTPVVKREAVAHLKAHLGLSERRACQIAGADRKMVRYRSQRPLDTAGEPEWDGSLEKGWQGRCGAQGGGQCKCGAPCVRPGAGHRGSTGRWDQLAARHRDRTEPSRDADTTGRIVGCFECQEFVAVPK